MRDKRKRGGRIVLLILLIVCAAGIVWAVQPEVEKQSYPLAYTSQIAQSAEEYGVDPYLVAAVIRTESGFDTDAVSRVGARGLMQLMPETGSWIAEKLGMQDYTDDALFDPTVNVQFGCWYLRFLQDRFGDSTNLIAAAYNAGHNRVRKWLSDESIAPSGNLTNVPYEETDEYIRRVISAEETYRRLYPDAFTGRV